MLDCFAGEFRTVEVAKKAVGTHVDGEWIPGSSLDETASMIAIPITPAQLKHLPEGKYKAGDMRFYAKGPQIYASNDIITCDGIKYMIGDIMDRSAQGNYTIYYGKRVVEQ
ncbi:MAG: hypothetical protein JW807_00890 [Spirochaetes bacterium]|nr:hypothetical protein [Spirochaetota bacterium]